MISHCLAIAVYAVITAGDGVPRAPGANGQPPGGNALQLDRDGDMAVPKARRRHSGHDIGSICIGCALPAGAGEVAPGAMGELAISGTGRSDQQDVEHAQLGNEIRKSDLRFAGSLRMADDGNGGDATAGKMIDNLITDGTPGMCKAVVKAGARKSTEDIDGHLAVAAVEICQPIDGPISAAKGKNGMLAIGEAVKAKKDVDLVGRVVVAIGAFDLTTIGDVDMLVAWMVQVLRWSIGVLVSAICELCQEGIGEVHKGESQEPVGGTGTGAGPAPPEACAG